MFLQPILLIEEVEQLPISLCRTKGNNVPRYAAEVDPSTLTTFLKDLGVQLQDAQMADDSLQNLITWARSINGDAGWAFHSRLTDYQNIAREVQTPTDYFTLSVEDRESLEGYINLRFDGPTDKELAAGPSPSSILQLNLSEPTFKHQINVSPKAGVPLLAGANQAFASIKKKELLHKIMMKTRANSPTYSACL